MLIRSITAKNFRTLEDFSVNLSDGYCTLSGQNNAGKTAIVKIIEFFLRSRQPRFGYYASVANLNYERDCTQWSGGPIAISLTLQLDRQNDSEILFVVDAFSSSDDAEKRNLESAMIRLSHIVEKGKDPVSACEVNGVALAEQNASEIIKKFQSSSSVVIHNSTGDKMGNFFSSGSFMEILASHLSQDDRDKISAAQKNLQSKIKRATKNHKNELDLLLGKLSDSFQVELSSIEDEDDSSFPLQIKLSDKSVVTHLHHWGAGTQNRTRVLVSVMEAVHTRSSATEANKVSPVFVVEEPESFLHPSAQAEFGKVLNEVAAQSGVQIIATTHSPYLLNQRNPDCNYLIHRKLFRGVPKGAVLIDTSGDDWMKPFAETLGVVPSEFEGWRQMFGAVSSKIVLVEGLIDVKYFEFIKQNYPKIYSIPVDVEIVPYGGSGALKNTSILSFMINKFSNVFITSDLDAFGDVKTALERIGLTVGDDFCPIGVDRAGYQCIEGLLPEDVQRVVYGANLELVAALGSADGKARTSAKSKLKNAMLDAFCQKIYPDSEMKGFKSLFDLISKKFR